MNTDRFISKRKLTELWEDWDAAFYRWVTHPTAKNERAADARLKEAQEAQKRYDEQIMARHQFNDFRFTEGGL